MVGGGDALRRLTLARVYHWRASNIDPSTARDTAMVVDDDVVDGVSPA